MKMEKQQKNRYKKVKQFLSKKYMKIQCNLLIKNLNIYTYNNLEDIITYCDKKLEIIKKQLDNY